MSSLGGYAERVGKIGGWIGCLNLDVSGGVDPPGDKTWRVVRRVGARRGVQGLAIPDEEIKNPRDRVFHLDVNATLGDGRNWKPSSKVFYQLSFSIKK